MSIVGVNSLLNQYVPTFYIRNIVDGQILVYDSVRKAFVNTSAGSSRSGGVDRLGELLDVSDDVDNPLNLQEGQALVYNKFTGLWENRFVDFNTLLNAPTNSSYSFIGLNDVDPIPVPNGFVKWDPTGTRLIYTTTIPASDIDGLADVATSGDYDDLINKPDLTVTLTGDATGSGIGIVPVTLSIVNLAPGVYGDDHFVPTITVNAKGLVTSITTQHVDNSVRDFIPETETLVISTRHQYVLTSELEVEGLIENNGVIAIL